MKLSYPSVQKRVPNSQNYIQGNSPSVVPMLLNNTLELKAHIKNIETQHIKSIGITLQQFV